MAIEVTNQQKRELQSKGYVVKPVEDVVYNRRSFWDPKKDESGKVFGWTLPLPADSLRMTHYLAKGFLLQDPDGNLAPPRGYFRRDTGIPSPGLKTVNIPEKGLAPTTSCPICQKDFPDTDSLITHMYHHRSGEAKKKASKKPKRRRNKNTSEK